MGFKDMDLVKSDLTNFKQKWDNGEGIDWRLRGGCGCNKADSGGIFPAEVESVGSYDELVTDLMSIKANGETDPNSTESRADRDVAVSLFDGDVFYEVLDKLDPKAKTFFEGIDNGELGGTKKDGWLQLPEISNFGGPDKFEEELNKLSAVGKEFVLARLWADADKQMKMTGIDRFMATYDNGKGFSGKAQDGLINNAEVDFVGDGWKQLVKDVEKLSPIDRKKALDSLKDLPPENEYAELAKLMPDYFDQTNLAQFPNVYGVYIARDKAFEMIKKVTGRTFDKIDPSTLPSFEHRLAVTEAEQFYIDLRKFVVNKGSRITLDELVSLERADKTPRATNAELHLALSENERRYMGQKYLMKPYAVAVMGGEEETGRTKNITIMGNEENEDDIRTLKQLKVRYHRKEIETPSEVETQAQKKKKYEYTFEIPVLSAEYMVLACDTAPGNGFDIGAGNCSLVRFSGEFAEFERGHRGITQNSVDESDMMEYVSKREGVTLSPQRAKMALNFIKGGLMFNSGLWYLEGGELPLKWQTVN